MMALPGFAKDKRGKQAMKIISYNIEYGMRADTTAGKTIFSTWMRNQDPDIVCLQEANKFTQKSLEALAASYGHPYAVLQKEKGFPTAITSKYPIVNIMKVENNMWHGFVMGTINGYHIISLHLSPHRYESRQLDIDHSRNGSSWVTSIPYPPSMPENMPTDAWPTAFAKKKKSALH